MEPEPGGQATTEEHTRTERAIHEVARGRSYRIDVSKLDSQSVIDLRRLLRDLDDRYAELRTRTGVTKTQVK